MRLGGVMPEFRDPSRFLRYKCHGNPPHLPYFAPTSPNPIFFFLNSVSEMSFLLGVILPKKFNILRVFSPLEGVAHSLHKEQNLRCFSQIRWDGAESQPQSWHHWWCPCLRRPGRTVMLPNPSSYCSLHDRTINQEMTCLNNEWPLYLESQQIMKMMELVYPELKFRLLLY